MKLKEVAELISKFDYSLDPLFKSKVISSSIAKDYYLAQIQDRMSLSRVVEVRDSRGRLCGLACYQFLDFDSRILKLKTGKMHFILTKDKCYLEDLINKLIPSLKSDGMEYVTFRFYSGQKALYNSLIQMGFIKLDSYIILLSGSSNYPISRKITDEYRIREAKLEDIKILQDHHAHTFTFSRFFKDSVLAKSAAIEMHRKWIENSVKKKVADNVLVAVDDLDIPIGFITLEVLNRGNICLGHIPLIGVRRDPEFVGKGIGNALQESGLAWMYTRGAKYFVIETQGDNFSAIKSYERAGFKEVTHGVTLRWCNSN